MGKRYYIKASGAAWDIRGNTPEDAIDSIRKNLHCYCTIQAFEIGKDVDENGWALPAPKDEVTK